MKKMIALFLMIVMLFSMVACSGFGGKENTGSENTNVVGEDENIGASDKDDKSGNTEPTDKNLHSNCVVPDDNEEPSKIEDSFIEEESTVSPEEPDNPSEAAVGDFPPVETTTPDVETDVISDWNLLLVNPWNKLPDNFFVELKQFDDGHAIDERIHSDLQAMMDDARAQGLSPILCSSYRTQEFQQKLFDNKIKRLIAAGYPKEDAEVEASKWVAVPGTSEHQTGLSVDIVAFSYQLLDENQAKTDEQQWLIENSYKYGFILRYPEGKTDITGIYYEPWHYRYVGKEAAKEIYEQGVCLEEYLREAEIL